MRAILLLFACLCAASVCDAQYYPYGFLTWKAPVASSAALPLVGNVLGDVRIETTAFGEYVWNGTAWVLLAGGGGSGPITGIGTLDGNTASSNGLSIATNLLYAQSASSTEPGLVNTTTQTFAGAKTVSAPFTITGLGANQDGLVVSATLTNGGSANQAGVFSEPVIDQTENNNAAAFWSKPATLANEGVVLTNLFGFYAQNPTKGASSIITNNYGVYVQDQTAGSGNYAIYTEDGGAGTGAPIYFGGQVTLGDIGEGIGALQTFSLQINQLYRSGSNLNIISNTPTFIGGGVSATANDYYAQPSVSNSADYSKITDYYADNPGGSSSGTTVGTAYGVQIANITAGSTNYSVYTGTAPSQFGGTVTSGVNDATAGAFILQAAGSTYTTSITPAPSPSPNVTFQLPASNGPAGYYLAAGTPMTWQSPNPVLTLPVSIANGGVTATSAVHGAVPNTTSTTVASWTATPTLGVASSTTGQLKLASAGSAYTDIIQPGPSPSPGTTFSLPTETNATDTLGGLAAAQTWSAANTFSTTLTASAQLLLGSSSSSTILIINETAPAAISGTTQRDIYADGTFNSSGTAANIGVDAAINTAASTAVTSVYDFNAETLNIGSSGSVTNFINYLAQANTSATNNAAFADTITGMSGNYFLYQNGSVASQLGGALTVAKQITSTANLTGDLYILNSGNQGDTIVFDQNGGGNYNWMIGSQHNNNGVFEITSGANNSGSTTFGTATQALKITANGAHPTVEIVGAATLDSTVNMTGISSGTSALSYLCYNPSGGAVTSDSSGTCLVSLSDTKEDVSPLQNALSEVMDLKPVSFNYKKEYNPNNWGRQVGFIAEEVEKVDPRIAAYDKNGKLKSVRYEQITAIDTAAIQELKKEIDELRSEIKALKASK